MGCGRFDAAAVTPVSGRASFATASRDAGIRSVLIFWIAIGWIGFGLLPWYGVEDFWTFEWLTDGWPLDTDYAPALSLLAQGEKL